jgi:DNA-binding response OmpR family regulator
VKPLFSILVVEDDENTRKFLGDLLKTNGYLAHAAADGDEALKLLERQHIDLMIVDIMMPKMDGYELTQALRENDIAIPVLMVSAKQLPNDKYRGFLSGTDDYMTKPFDNTELLLRIQALLRRARIIHERKIHIGEVVLDYDGLAVRRGHVTVCPPPKEFFLLYKLMSYPGRIFTRAELMNEIWGYDTDSADTTVNVHVNRLRKRFESFPEFDIVTIRLLGYKGVKNVIQ